MDNAESCNRLNVLLWYTDKGLGTQQLSEEKDFVIIIIIIIFVYYCCH